MKVGKMKRVPLLSFAAATAALFVAGSASAQVANTTKEGSVLVWPLISVDASKTALYGTEDTIVELSNASSNSVHVECYYVNESKFHVDFDFTLTGKQTVTWDVLKHQGDHVVPPPFPTSQGKYSGGGGYPSPDLNRGELICFATDSGVLNQVSFNHLSGTATFVTLNYTGAAEPKEGFKYNAWSFCALDNTGCTATDNTVEGTAGDIALTGTLAVGNYDACPATNVASFMPNGAKLGNITTVTNNLTVSGCDQDVTENYNYYLTKLLFNIWNSDEDSFSGTYICVDSVETIGLNDADSDLVNASNFDHSTLRTANARFEVSGISNGICPKSNNVGVLGVLHEPSGLQEKKPVSDMIAGNDLYGEGSITGFILWEPF